MDTLYKGKIKTVSLNTKIKKVAYIFGNVESISMFCIALFVVGVRNVIHIEFRNMIEIHDSAFFIISYFLLFCYLMLFINMVFGVDNVEKQMKKHGIAVIR